MAQQNSTDSIAAFQPLEPRQLCSATLARRTLTITGTHKADSITISVNLHSGDQITVVDGDTSKTFPLANIDFIAVFAGQGNDYVFVDNENSRLNRPVSIYGSGGNDTLLGGGGKDRIYGGNGNDSLRGANTADVLYGEAGNDTIDGGEGNDYISGGSGNDSLTGGSGVDFLFGLSGNDTLVANDGTTDRVDGGGAGRDVAFTDGIDGVVGIEVVR